jgi:hypothetical protein
MFAKGDLNGIEQLDDQQNQQNPIKYLHCAGIPCIHALYKLDGTPYEKSERTAGEEQSKADVHDILNRPEGTGDPHAGGILGRIEWAHRMLPF